MTAAPTSPAVPLYDSAGLRALERLGIAEAGGDAFVLMARAGLSAWRELLDRWPQAQSILVACGPGNNGGDGYVLARHALESGRRVRVLQMPGAAPGTALARRACDEYLAAGGEAIVFDGVLPQAELLVDALFGIGLTRALEGEAARLVAAIDAAGAPVFALDVPSGLDGDRGRADGIAVRASHTLQFIAAHAGLWTGAAGEYVGTRAVAALDIGAHTFAQVEPVAFGPDAASLGDGLPPRGRNAHKGDSGHVLCIGGDTGKGGAAMLAAEAALRSGAGLVSVATRLAHVPALLARLPEAMAEPVESAAQLAPMIERASVIAVGPGLGQQTWAQSLLDAALASGRPLVLDADALNLLAMRPCSLGEDTVLTPHPGEAARLLGTTTAEVQADRFAAVRALCERHGCVVVLKGAGTLVAAPGRRTRVIAAGNPGMAVGGMGDVLTGCIAALRAQGLAAFEAACTGALLHAVAGDRAAEAGQRGLLPSDLFPWLRRGVNAGAQA